MFAKWYIDGLINTTLRWPQCVNNGVTTVLHQVIYICLHIRFALAHTHINNVYYRIFLYNIWLGQVGLRTIIANHYLMCPYLGHWPKLQLASKFHISDVENHACIATCRNNQTYCRSRASWLGHIGPWQPPLPSGYWRARQQNLAKLMDWFPLLVLPK